MGTQKSGKNDIIFSVKDRDIAEHDFERVGDALTEQTAQKRAPAYNPLSRVFMALDKEEWLIGEAIVTQNWGKLEVDLMFVRPEYRGKGVGKKLMSAIDDFAVASGLKSIRLNTPTWQGVGFYEKCGYTEMGRIPLEADEDGNPQFEVTYFKNLPAKNL